jgi:hypothetical protein
LHEPPASSEAPTDVQLDGELVGLNGDGRPDFDRLGARMLHDSNG